MTLPIQSEEEERFLVRVAWLYHIEGQTQGAIAEHLAVTRLRVNRALADARRLGIVRVGIHSDLAPCLELERAAKARFGLKDAMIVPSPADADNVQIVIGAALGQYLSTLLGDDRITLFGMSWGNTLNLATRFVTPVERPDLEIVSVMGGLTQGSDVNTFEITTRLATLLGARHSYFTAPLYAGSKESRDTMLVLDVFQDVLRKIAGADAVAVGVGDMSPRSLLIRDGLPRDVDVEDLIAAGAVGDVHGQFLDAAGRLVDHPINDRVIGIGLDALRRMNHVILAAGGAHKVPILTAALGGGGFDVLVTDERTARAILEAAKAAR